MRKAYQFGSKRVTDSQNALQRAIEMAKKFPHVQVSCLLLSHDCVCERGEPSVPRLSALIWHHEQISQHFHPTYGKLAHVLCNLPELKPTIHYPGLNSMTYGDTSSGIILQVLYLSFLRPISVFLIIMAALTSFTVVQCPEGSVPIVASCEQQSADWKPRFPWVR